MKRSGIFLLLLTLAGCEFIDFPIGGGGSPKVDRVRPADGDSNVSIGAQVTADLDLPNGGLSQTTVDEQSVRLSNVATGEVVESSVIADNDARILTLDPATNLDFSTQYRFTITSAVEDESGEAFVEHTSTFTTISDDVPAVIASRPADGERNVPVNIPGIATDLNIPNGSVDATTLTDDSVYLVNLDTGERVDGSQGTTGAGDSITFTPSGALEPLTDYQFTITSAVTDETGVAFLPYTSTFTTGQGGGAVGDIESISQPTAASVRHSSLAFGPDGNLYATTVIGEIKRYPVDANGNLGTPTTITSLLQAEGGPRLTIGLAFDPASTPGNPIVWVTHSELGSFDDDGGGINKIDAPWAGKLTRLSGPNLENVEDVVINLPRSNKDHVTNSVAFNPAEPGVVYFVQGSNTAMGAPDPAWGPQGERALTGAVLRLDTNLLGSNLPLNAQTEDGGTYDPFAPGAPLTVYASGTRNSYDLVWHSNGNLYVPANGSAARGIVPRYDPQKALPGLCEDRINGEPYTGPMLSDPSALDDYITSIPEGETDGWVIDETQNDYLFEIEEGGYYGTPNPKRCEWILNGGGGSNSESTDNVPDYPSSVEPDPNYRGFVYDFGTNISPNGSLEYQGNAFSNLRGKLLVTRYSNGSDVVAVSFDGNGDVVGEATPIVPSGVFVDPIDIAEDPDTGYLYVSDYDQLSGEAAPGAGITLLRP